MFDKTLFIIILPVIFIFSMTAIWKLYATNSWYSAPGNILSIEKETISHITSSSSSSGRAFEYKINLKYEYTVNDKTYYGGQLYAMIPNVFSSEQEADQFLQQFSSGSQVDVFYNPENIADSCLLSSQVTFTQFLILAGMFIFIFSLVVVGIIFFNRL